MRFTAKQVEQSLEQGWSTEGVNVKGVDVFADLLYRYQNKLIEYQSGDLPVIKYVDSRADYASGEAELGLVFSVGDQLFQIEGYDSSFEGATWEKEIKEVAAVQVVKTDYRLI